jgi:hypothetical protein
MKSGASNCLKNSMTPRFASLDICRKVVIGKKVIVISKE